MGTPLQLIREPLFDEKKVQVWLKREDLNHPVISGNKWRKLKYNLQAAVAAGEKTLLTFGGAFSNHIAAVAAAGKESGLKTLGIIRGEESSRSNATLSQAASNGMELHFINRSSYREKERNEYIAELHLRFGNFYLLPEGGTNELAVVGCEEIVAEIVSGYDYLCCPCATGGTLAGLITGDKGIHQVIGFSALKGVYDLENKVSQLVWSRAGKHFSNWSINHEYHFGGYAKLPVPLIEFIHTFYIRHKILPDPVYTGKMLYGIYNLIRSDFFNIGTVIVAVHTGGLQGWNGFKNIEQVITGTAHPPFL